MKTAVIFKLKKLIPGNHWKIGRQFETFGGLVNGVDGIRFDNKEYFDLVSTTIVPQLTFDYQLVDDNGVSQAEDVPMLLQKGSIFKHEYGTYRVMEHVTRTDGDIMPYCERISKEHL